MEYWLVDFQETISTNDVWKIALLLVLSVQ